MLVYVISAASGVTGAVPCLVLVLVSGYCLWQIDGGTVYESPIKRVIGGHGFGLTGLSLKSKWVSCFLSLGTG